MVQSPGPGSGELASVLARGHLDVLPPTLPCGRGIPAWGRLGEHHVSHPLAESGQSSHP